MRIGGRWSVVLAVIAGCQDSPIRDQRSPSNAPSRAEAPLAAGAPAAAASAAPVQAAGAAAGTAAAGGTAATAGSVPSASSSAQAAPSSAQADGSSAVPPSDPSAESKREALETVVRPFLPASVDNLLIQEGPFGPSPKTIVVVTFTGQGRGDFSSFALVPDRSAQHGYRKLLMPWLPSGSTSGEMEFAAIGNLDRDAALELVVTTQVTRVAGGKQGYTYNAFEPVVLDWDARRRRFARLTPVETRLKAAFPEVEELPSGEDVSKALGIEP